MGGAREEGEADGLGMPRLTACSVVECSAGRRAANKSNLGLTNWPRVALEATLADLGLELQRVEPNRVQLEAKHNHSRPKPRRRSSQLALFYLYGTSD